MNARASHTPGPWAVEDPMGPDEYAIVQDGLKAYEWQFIATISVGVPAECLMPRQEAKANARLIAAAPDLLAALIRLEATARILPVSMDTEDSPLAQARAAIAKAEGRA